MRLRLAPLMTAILVALSANYICASSEQTEGTVQPPNFCQGCRALVSYVGHFNVSENRDKYKEVFKTYCELNYPSSTDYQDGPCPFTINFIYKVFDMVDPVHHCDDIGACGPVNSRAGESSLEELRDMTNASKDGICSICQQIIQQFKDQLDNPDAIQMLRSKLNAFCEYMKVVNEEKECKDVVNNYIDQVVSFINKIDPMGYCQGIHICDATSSRLPMSEDDSTRLGLFGNPQAEDTRSRPTFADFNKFGIETSVIIGDKVVKDINQPATNSKALKKPTPNCMLCKTIVKELFKFIRDNRTEDNIRQGLDKVCQIIFHHHHDTEQNCEELVSAYSREIIDLLTQETDPSLICTLIDQCVYPQDKSDDATITTTTTDTTISTTTTIEKDPTLGDFISALDSSIGLNSPETCIECKLFIRYLQNVLDKPKSKEEVKNFLLKELCGSIDDQEVKNQCETMINKYAEAFFTALALELDPKVACVELGACKKSNRDIIATLFQARRPPQQVQVAQNNCAVCIETVEKTDEMVSQSNVHPDFAQLADTVCDHITNKDGCIDVFNKLGVRIGRAIMAMKSPSEICRPEFCKP